MVELKNSFTMLVGLPGSGKSTIANNLKTTNTVIVSSDEIRKELFGDESIQKDPDTVFNLMLKRTIDNLNNGIDVIYDATNLNRKKRINLLKELNKRVKNEFVKSVFVIYASVNECLRRNSERSRTVPDYVIDRLLKTFDIPIYGEGWDKVDLIYSEEPVVHFTEALDYYGNDIPHDNSHHKVSIKSHMELARDCFESCFDETKYPRYLKFAILFHDIGKAYCKTFINYKGDMVDEAHYYQHANVGSYFALGLDFTYPFNEYDGKNKFVISEEDKYKLAILIAFHMRPLEAWQQSSYTIKKDKELLGEELFNYLLIVNQCDIKSEEKQFVENLFNYSEECKKVK